MSKARRNSPFGERAGPASHAPRGYLDALRRGWADAQSPTGVWPRDYDAMTRDQQLGYEFGRQMLCNVLVAGLPVPAVRSNDDIALFEAAIRRAAAKVGPAFPRWHA